MTQDLGRFPELFMPIQNSALRYCRTLIAGNQNYEAEELLQQSLLIALENFSKLRDEDKFKPWLFKIITRAFYSYTRKNFWKRHISLDSENNINEYGELPKIFEDEEIDESRKILLQALSKIKKRDRSAFILYAVEEFSLEEIKKMQNELSVSTVKSRIYRTKKKLQEYILKYKTNTIYYNRKVSSRNLKLAGEIENEIYK
jgi:RNA polymerase sigma factor (sigma-70 family)